MKRLLIRLLFKLIAPNIENYSGIDDKAINAFLDLCSGHPGFRQYMMKRDFILLKTLGAYQAKDAYLLTLGQRVETLHFMQKVDDRIQVREKKDKELKAEAERKKEAKGGGPINK